MSADQEALVLIYKATFLTHQDATEYGAVEKEFATALEKAENPQIRARALQLLVYYLCHQCLRMRAFGKVELSDDLENRVRSLCEQGLQEFSQYTWFGSSRFMLRGALGILDYDAGRVAEAGLHLQSALDAYRSLSGRERAITDMIGHVYSRYGLIAREKGDLRAAGEYFRRSVREVSGIYRLGAYTYLLDVLLRERRSFSARRTARRALREGDSLIGQDPFGDLFMVSLAEGAWKAGARREALQVLKRVSSSERHQQAKELAMACLRSVSSENDFLRTRHDP